MKRLPIIVLLALLAASGLLTQGCGESDCPLTTTSYARFDFMDATTHQPLQRTEALDVTGFVVTDVTIRETLADGTVKETVVKDSLIEETVYNQASSYMSLPLSYTTQTSFVLHYTERMRDTIVVTHRNIPYLENIECGTMMFYEVEDVKYTTYNLRSIEIVNPDINNEEKTNFYIYYDANTAQ